MSEVTLNSGATLKIQVSPFAVSKALYQSVLKELKNLGYSMKTDLGVFFKDVFCVAFSSPEIEACLWKCFERCTIDNVKIVADSFEPLERREDYTQVCMEVGKANILPFVKGLYAEYQRLSAMIEGIQA